MTTASARIDAKTGRELWVTKLDRQRKRRSDHLSRQERQAICRGGRHRHAGGLCAAVRRGTDRPASLRPVRPSSSAPGAGVCVTAAWRGGCHDCLSTGSHHRRQQWHRRSVRGVAAGRNRSALDGAARRSIAGGSQSSERDGRTVATVIADLATEIGRSEVIDRAAACEIDLLICNAGAGVYGSFQSTAPQAEHDALELNVIAPCLLIHALLPGMLNRARTTHRRAGIIHRGQRCRLRPDAGGDYLCSGQVFCAAIWPWPGRPIAPRTDRCFDVAPDLHANGVLLACWIAGAARRDERRGRRPGSLTGAWPA